MNAKICPKCGTPQQWENWRLCGCGYDFGPPDKLEDQGNPLGTRHEKKRTRDPFNPEDTIASSLFWVLGLVVLAVLTGAQAKPPWYFTCGSVVLGLVSACMTVLHWKLRSHLFGTLSLMTVFLGVTFLDEYVSGPRMNRWQSIHGIAVAGATGLILFKVFQGPILRFCRSIPDECNSQRKTSEAREAYPASSSGRPVPLTRGTLALLRNL